MTPIAPLFHTTEMVVRSGDALGAAAVDATDRARFDQAMAAAVSPVEAIGEASPAVAAQGAALAPAVVEAGPATLGDRMLAGMQGLSTDFRQSWETVAATLQSGETMTMTDMLKLQMGLTQMAIQTEWVGKAISRSTQNLDQLVKMQ